MKLMVSTVYIDKYMIWMQTRQGAESLKFQVRGGSCSNHAIIRLRNITRLSEHMRGRRQSLFITKSLKYIGRGNLNYEANDSGDKTET
jgi:hypothetical protein